jgi:hypothetical protein
MIKNISYGWTTRKLVESLYKAQKGWSHVMKNQKNEILKYLKERVPLN